MQAFHHVNRLKDSVSPHFIYVIPSYYSSFSSVQLFSLGWQLATVILNLLEKANLGSHLIHQSVF